MTLMEYVADNSNALRTLPCQSIVNTNDRFTNLVNSAGRVLLILL